MMFKVSQFEVGQGKEGHGGVLSCKVRYGL